MSSFIKRLLYFLLFCTVIYVCLIGFWGYFTRGKIRSNVSYQRGSNGHMFTRLKEVETLKNVDIVFLGSSHSYRGFDPRIFKNYGFTSFNLGSSSQTPPQTLVLTKRYLKQLNPKIVIYEVYPTTLLNISTESALDIISNGEIDIPALLMVFEVNALKVYNTLIYAIIHNLLNIESQFVEQPVIGPDRYVEGGYVERQMDFIAPKQSNVKIRHDLANERFESFAENLKFIEQNSNAKVVLVYAPITSGLYNFFEGKVEFDKKLKTFGVYYNFNLNPILADSLHFYDAQHLNQDGVKIFNAALIEQLQKDSLL